MGERVVTGIPCVGGKTNLADYICDIIENTCLKNGIKKYCSACGGGGKDILSLNHKLFDDLIYNEYETGLSKLFEALTDSKKVSLIKRKITNIIGNVLAINVNTSDIVPDMYRATSSIVRELRSRALFEYARKHADDKDNDIITSAAYATMLIYGSVQNNRIGVYVDTKPYMFSKGSNKPDFLTNLYYQQHYIDSLRSIADIAKHINKVLNMDCVELVKEKSDDKDLFIYIDPPYYSSINGYVNNLGFIGHCRLFDACINSKSKIMISMDDDGVLPYLLMLHKATEKGWQFYKTPSMRQNSKKPIEKVELLQKLKKIELKNTDDTSEHMDSFKNLDIDGLGMTSILEEEYILCNFPMDKEIIDKYNISLEYDENIFDSLYYDQLEKNKTDDIMNEKVILNNKINDTELNEKQFFAILKEVLTIEKNKELINDAYDEKTKEYDRNITDKDYKGILEFVFHNLDEAYPFLNEYNIIDKLCDYADTLKYTRSVKVKIKRCFEKKEEHAYKTFNRKDLTDAEASRISAKQLYRKKFDEVYADIESLLQ